MLKIHQKCFDEAKSEWHNRLYINCLLRLAETLCVCKSVRAENFFCVRVSWRRARLDWNPIRLQIEITGAPFPINLIIRLLRRAKRNQLLLFLLLRFFLGAGGTARDGNNKSSGANHRFDVFRSFYDEQIKMTHAPEIISPFDARRE